MNERIEQLLKQSMEDLPRPDYHKFAQLIVQECISVLDKEIYLAIREDGEQTHIDVILLEHFEAEE